MAFVLDSAREDVERAAAVLGPLIGWLFIGTGLYAQRRRPESRTGVLMVVLGFTWFFASLAFSNSPLLFTLASFTAGLWGGVFLHIVIAFPSGRLAPGRDRALALAGYFVVTVGTIPSLLFADPAELGCSGCPENLLFIRSDDALAALTIGWVALLHVALFGVTFLRLAGRWRRAGVLERLQLTPVYLCALVTFLFGIVARAGAPELFWAAYGSTALLPFAFLAGLPAHPSLPARRRAAGPRGGAPRVARPARGGGRRRAAPPGARPPRRRAVAARRHSPSSSAPRGSAPRTAPTSPRCSTRPRPSCRRASPSCASWPAASTPPCSTDRGLEPALQALAARAPVPVTVEAAADGAAAAARRDRGLLRGLRGAGERGQVRARRVGHGGGPPGERQRHRRGERRRRGRRRRGARLGPARPRRPRGGARRHPLAGQPAGPRHAPAGGDPGRRIRFRALSVRDCCPAMEAGKVLWEPPAELLEHSAMARSCATQGHEDYESLWRWSVDDLEAFWGAIWDFFGVEGAYDRVLADASMPGAELVPGRRGQLRRAPLPRQARRPRRRSATPPSCGRSTPGRGTTCASARRGSAPGWPPAASAAATASRPTCPTCRTRSRPSSPPPRSARSGPRPRPSSARAA